MLGLERPMLPRLRAYLLSQTLVKDASRPHLDLICKIVTLPCRCQLRAEAPPWSAAKVLSMAPKLQRWRVPRVVLGSTSAACLTHPGQRWPPQPPPRQSAGARGPLGRLLIALSSGELWEMRRSQTMRTESKSSSPRHSMLYREPSTVRRSPWLRFQLAAAALPPKHRAVALPALLRLAAMLQHPRGSLTPQSPLLPALPPTRAVLRGKFRNTAGVGCRKIMTRLWRSSLWQAGLGPKPLLVHSPCLGEEPRAPAPPRPRSSWEASLRRPLMPLPPPPRRPRPLLLPGAGHRTGRPRRRRAPLPAPPPARRRRPGAAASCRCPLATAAAAAATGPQRARRVPPRSIATPPPSLPRSSASAPSCR
mmetsp:Transcript_105555/g.273308  ORF Transcript_105555/g.273308 Transcript_105555/m.273308 type:complete len:364 (-) Transcript_105555:733-1824(-)